MILHIIVLSLPSALCQFEIMKMDREEGWHEPSPIEEFTDEANRMRERHLYRREDTRRQFAPMGLQPDVAFGDDNDRFDLTGVYKQHKHKYRGDEDVDRRRFLPQVSRRSNSRYHPKYRRDDEDWMEDLRSAGESTHGDFDIANRAQNYRRHRRRQNNIADRQAGTTPPPNEREIVLNYALPIRIKVQDLVNGSFITGINLL